MGKVEFGLGIAILLITLFLFVSADVIFGSIAPQIKTSMLTYLILMLIILTVFKENLVTAETSVTSLVYFFGGFLITALILSAIPIFTSFVGTVSIAGYTGEPTFKFMFAFLFVQAFVIAYIETMFFQYAIPNLLNVTTSLSFGFVVSQLIFGFFHYGMLKTTIVGSPLMSAVILGMLGSVWLLIRLFAEKRWGKSAGIYAATGSHVAWNLFVLGVLAL